jgi:putative ABC transport system substrate-binding protein
MRRRELIVLVGGAAVAWPLAARAQQPVVGWLAPGSLTATGVAAVRRGLSDAGYVEGRNLAIEYGIANGHYNQLPALADELVRKHVDVIIAHNTAAAVAAKGATKTIPISFITGTNPVQVGLVLNLNRPGGNLTGIALMYSEVMGKRLELLHELVPSATPIGFIANLTNPVNAEAETKELLGAARILGVRLVVAKASNESEFDAAFATLVGEGVRGLVVSGDILFVDHVDRIVALAARYRVPTIYPDRIGAAGGGLMACGTDLEDAFRQLGVYAGRLLKGENPSDLPIQQVTKVQVAINLKTAKALGLTFPVTLLGRADEVIE